MAEAMNTALANKRRLLKLSILIPESDSTGMELKDEIQRESASKPMGSLEDMKYKAGERPAKESIISQLPSGKLSDRVRKKTKA